MIGIYISLVPVNTALGEVSPNGIRVRLAGDSALVVMGSENVSAIPRGTRDFGGSY